jgi:hemerythrin-like metal-binding protein
LGSPDVISDLSTYLKLWYTDPLTNPVTALVFGPAVVGASTMAPQYLQCYLDAGIESQVFVDYVSALAWVESRIYQSSEKLQWKDAYRVGDADIDEQHQELFKRAHNILHAVTNAEQAHAAMRLFEYTRTHFSFEEECMRRIRYPDLDSHRALHMELSKKLGSISRSIAKNELVKEELEDFVSHWLLIHIATVDKRLADYCQENGK